MWISRSFAVQDEKSAVDNFGDNSRFPVDNYPTYPQLSTGGLRGVVIHSSIHSLSTAYPQSYPQILLEI
jgi:hypothetical protein